MKNLLVCLDTILDGILHWLVDNGVSLDKYEFLSKFYKMSCKCPLVSETLLLADRQQSTNFACLN